MHSNGSIVTKRRFGLRRDDDETPRSRRSDDGEAFLHDPQGGPAHSNDELAENLAEGFLSSATSANESTEDTRDQVQTEELGGPFLQGRASAEFANDIDETNPVDAVREPFPTAMRSADK